MKVVHQILGVLEAPAQRVHEKVFYVGDRPIKLLDWVNGFSNQLVGHNVRVVPRPIVMGLAAVGDLVSSVTGKRCLLTSSRLRSMTDDYLAPMEPVIELLGEPPYSMRQGVVNVHDTTGLSAIANVVGPSVFGSNYFAAHRGACFFAATVPRAMRRLQIVQARESGAHFKVFGKVAAHELRGLLFLT